MKTINKKQQTPPTNEAGVSFNPLLSADWRNLKSDVPLMTPTQWSKDVLLINKEGKQWVDSLFYDEDGKVRFWLSRRTDATHWMPLPVPPICR